MPFTALGGGVMLPPSGSSLLPSPSRTPPMFCTACASSNPGSRTSCVHCGARLEPASAAAPDRPRASRRRGAARFPRPIALVLLVTVPLLAAAASVAAFGQFAERDRLDRDRALAAALLDGDLDRARRVADRPNDEEAIGLAALTVATDLARDARTTAVVAIADGDWDEAIGALGPSVRALPGDGDGQDLLVAARSRRIAAWANEERRAARAGDPLAQEWLLARLAAAEPGNPALLQRLRIARNANAPVALAQDRALWLVAPDGSDHRLVTDAVPVSRPIWSPDRTRIAFVSSDPLDGRAAGALYVVSPDGSGLRSIYRLAHPNAVPSWSPDGTAIALTSVADWDLRSETGLLTVRIVDVATGRSTGVSPQFGGHGTSPAWSPDGRFVAFIGRPELDDPRVSPLSGPSEVWIWSAADGMARSLTGNRAPGANRLVWSPAGDRVLVLTRARGLPGETSSASAGILSVDPISGTIDEIAARVGASTSSWAPAWSPDGARLAWVESPGVVVLRERSGDETRVPVGRFLSGSITWSPGGESLIAAAGDPAQPSARIDGIGVGPLVLNHLVLSDVELPYDGEWPTGAPQWGPPWPAPPPAATTIAGTGLDAAE